MLARADGHETPFRHEPLRRTLRAARTHRIVFASCVVMAVIGLTNGGVNLLVPLSLRDNGHSPGTIGLVFSASSSLFVVASLVLTRLGSRMVTLRVVGVAAMLYGATILLPVAGTSSALIVSFMLIRSPAWATLSTLSYPLGAVGAERADLGRGAVMGLLNLVWGAAGTLGPVLAAGIAQAAGVHSAFAVLAILMTATGVWLTASGRREREELRAVAPSLDAP